MAANKAYIPSRVAMSGVEITFDTRPITVRDLLMGLASCAAENAKRMKADKTYKDYPQNIADQEVVQDRLVQCANDIYADSKKNWQR